MDLKEADARTVLDLAHAGRTVEAVKHVRAVTGCPLPDAVSYVNALTAPSDAVPESKSSILAVAGLIWAAIGFLIIGAGFVWMAWHFVRVMLG